MAGAFIYFFVLMVPVAVIAAIFMGWSQISQSQSVRHMLRMFTFIVSGALTALSALLTYMVATCASGNIIYGYENCSVLTDNGAAMIQMGNVVGFASAILATTFMFLTAGVLELLARNRRPA